jgi:hypothetical protein
MRAATKANSRLAIDALMCEHQCVHSSRSGALLGLRSWVFMIAFPHDRPSTSNAPGPYVKRPVPSGGALA